MITGWESPEVLHATLADVTRRHQERIAAAQLTVGGPEDGVTVRIGADGFLTAVELEDPVSRWRTAADLADAVADAIGRAERAAAECRRQIAESEERS